MNLVIVGDLFPMPANIDLFKSGDAETLLGEKVLGFFRAADFSVCNLEGCLYDGKAESRKDGIRIVAETASVAAIKNMGITYASIANNHLMDYGPRGYVRTCKTLTEAGISWFGAGSNKDKIRKSVTFEKDGVTVTVYSVAETLFNVPTDDYPGVNIYDEYRVCHEIEQLKKKCDCLIVLYHGGVERFRYVTPVLKKRFHRMADSGADIVIAQHTHVVGAEEYYNNSYLLYGQGNFLFHYGRIITRNNRTGLLLQLDITRQGFLVHKHLVERQEKTICYAKQDFRVFNEISKRIAQGDTFEEEFKAFADSEIIKKGLLRSLRGINENDDREKEENPDAFGQYLMSQYTKAQLMRIYKILSAEEFHELVTRGILNMIERCNAEAASSKAEEKK